MWRAVTGGTVTVPALPPDASADSAVYAVPPRIELSDEPAGFPRPDGRHWTAEAPEGSLPTGHRFQLWSVQGDELRLVYSTGYAGLTGIFTPRDPTSWKGALRTFSDEEGTQRYQRDASLFRVSCDSPPPYPASVLADLPRSVELSGGARLTLGEPPPRGIATRRRPSGALGVDATTAGVFAGSDSVAFALEPRGSRVAVLQVIFPPPARADGLISRLAATLGAPDPNTSVPGGWWHSRVTELSVIPRPEGGFRVLLLDPRYR